MKQQNISDIELGNLFDEIMQQLTLLGRHANRNFPVPLTPEQLKTLLTLDLVGEPTPMAKLSSRIGVTPGALTRNVAGLVRKDYLTRERSADDDRVVRISLSREGYSVVSQIKKCRQEFFRNLFDNLTQSERRRLVESQHHILETYRQLLQTIIDRADASKAKKASERLAAACVVTARQNVGFLARASSRGF